MALWKLGILLHELVHHLNSHLSVGTLDYAHVQAVNCS